jgi:hypothetical protein
MSRPEGGTPTPVEAGRRPAFPCKTNAGCGCPQPASSLAVRCLADQNPKISAAVIVGLLVKVAMISAAPAPVPSWL